jgi:hypothetical protein
MDRDGGVPLLSRSLVALGRLDRDPISCLDRVLVGLAVLPIATFSVALLAPLGGVLESRIEAVWTAVGMVPLLATVALIAWALGLTPDRLPGRRGSSAGRVSSSGSSSPAGGVGRRARPSPRCWGCGGWRRGWRCWRRHAS